MKRILLCVSLLLTMTGMLVAQNYFRPGTVWTSQIGSTLSDPNPSIFYNKLLPEISVEGENVMPYVYFNDRGIEKLKLYMKTDGEKVYARYTDSDRKEWFLLYDFGLEVGESTTITYVGLDDSSDDDLKARVVCIEREIPYGEDEVPLMKLDAFVQKEDGERSVGPDYWIMGAGNFGRLTQPVTALEGIYERRLEVKTGDGEVIYRNPNYARIETPNENGIVISATNLVLSISGADPCSSVKVYSVSGSLINSKTGSEVGVEIVVPSKGIYLVEVNGVSYKVAV